MDNPPDGLWLLFIGFGLFFNGMLTLWETAILNSSKTLLERLDDDAYSGAKDALSIIDEPSPVLESIQVCLVTVAIFIGITVAKMLSPFVSNLLSPKFLLLPYGEMTVLAISGLFIIFLCLVLGNFLPKKISLHEPEHILCRHSKNLLAITRFLSFLRSFLMTTTDAVLVLFGVNPQIDDAVTEDEVKELIEQGTEDGTFEKTEQTMVERIFHMSDQTAYSLMTPRTRMMWLDLNDSPETNLSLIEKSKETVYIVGKSSLDEFCGILYAKDILNAFLVKPENVPDIKALVKEPLLIPRSMEPFRVLEKFRENGVKEGIVLDEYGGVIGFITYQDIIDEITADVSNMAVEDDPLSECGDNTWLIEGLCSIDDFKERFDLEKLPDEERGHYQTMGGFMTTRLGYIPHSGEKCQWDDFTFEVIAMDKARIDKIRLTREAAPSC